MIDDFKNLLRNRNYEVSLHINNDKVFATFPEKKEFPPQEKNIVSYDRSLYPDYMFYHLVMADIIRRCKAMNYDISLVSLYNKDKPISPQSFSHLIKINKDDRIKHNKIGDLIHLVKMYGLTPQIKNEAKEFGVFKALSLISQMSGVYDNE